MEESNGGNLLKPASSELLQASEDTRQEATQTSRDDDDDDDYEDDGDFDECADDERQLADPSLHVSYVENSSKKQSQSQDDKNVDSVDPSIKTLEAEIRTVESIETQTLKSPDEDLENVYEERPTIWRQRRASDDQVQQHNGLDQCSQTVHVDEERPAVVRRCSAAHRHCQDCDAVNNEHLDTQKPETPPDQRRQSIDQDYQNVDKECQTLDLECHHNSDLGQIDMETQDVQCETTHEGCQLSSREAQTDDSGMIVAATETDVDVATNAATTSDTNVFTVRTARLVYMCNCIITAGSNLLMSVTHLGLIKSHQIKFNRHK